MNSTITAKSSATAGHTPGPLAISKHATPAYAPQYAIYPEATGRDIAIIKGDNAKKDAILYAAAPELLAALNEAELALATVECQDPNQAAKNLRAAKERAARALVPVRAAIARATQS